MIKFSSTEWFSKWRNRILSIKAKTVPSIRGDRAKAWVHRRRLPEGKADTKGEK